jgi:hypothetical protein
MTKPTWSEILAGMDKDEPVVSRCPYCDEARRHAPDCRITSPLDNSPDAYQVRNATRWPGQPRQRPPTKAMVCRRDKPFGSLWRLK